MEVLQVNKQVFSRVLDLITNLKEIARIYHADNHKDLKEALAVYNEIEVELCKIFNTDTEYDFDELLTSVGLTRHGEA
jgi:serine protease inhibitor